MDSGSFGTASIYPEGYAFSVRPPAWISVFICLHFTRQLTGYFKLLCNSLCRLLILALCLAALTAVRLWPCRLCYVSRVKKWLRRRRVLSY